MDTRYHDHHHYNNNVQGSLCETEMNPDKDSDVELEEDIGNAHAQWDRLPPEILTTIFSYLTMSETELVENTCVSWNRSCNDPCLWRRMEFYFDGMDSLRLVATAFRFIALKGHYLRELVVRIGNPRLNQAWLMSECIQQLFDFISQSSPTCHIESLTIDNLIIFTQNRFFRLSKESILNSLNNFLRSQKNLKYVNVTSCKFNPAEGLKLIRALKCSGFKNNLQKLNLHDFFKRRFVTASRGFKIISQFPALQEICLDANDIDDTVLSWLTIQSPHKKRIRHLKLYFEALKPTHGMISRENWMAARQSCPKGLQVSFHFCGWMSEAWLKPFLSEAIPLVNCHICWKRVYRGPRTFYTDLDFLLGELATQNSSLLERFTLTSDVRASTELEDGLVRLVSVCPRLMEFNVLMSLSEASIASITTILSQRRHVVKCQFLPVQREQTDIITGSRLRHRGC